MNTNKFSRTLLITTALALLALPARSQGTGSFSGMVVLDKSTPLGGATVWYNNVQAMRSDSLGHRTPYGPRVSASVISASDGTFSVNGVPAGTYIVCASGTQPNHLWSRDWGGGNTVVNVSAGSTISGLTLNIRTGTMVTFNLSDPAGRIQFQAATATRAGYTNFRIGVVSNMGHYFARLLTHSATQ